MIISLMQHNDNWEHQAQNALVIHPLEKKKVVAKHEIMEKAKMSVIILAQLLGYVHMISLIWHMDWFKMDLAYL